jgi:hypothetical protein
MWMLLALLPLSFAQSADVTTSWVEPTCADEVIAEAARHHAQDACPRSPTDHYTHQYREVRHASGCEVHLHVWCEVPRSVPGYAPPGQVSSPTLYVDPRFGGAALSLDEGTYALRDIPMRHSGDWNDKVSSVRVPEGWTLRLCHDPHGMGRCSDFVRDTAELGQTYVGHDSATSVVVTRGDLDPTLACPRAFEHDNFRGRYIDMCQDQQNLYGSAWNDSISSVLVPAGWSVEVCAHAEGGAPCKQLTGDQAKMNQTVVGGDKISSWYVTEQR